MKKLLIATLTAATLVSATTPTVINVSASSRAINGLEQMTINKTIDGDSIEIAFTEDSYTVTNTDAGEKAVVEMSDENNAIVTDEKGNVSHIFKDDNGNMYLDGEKFATQTKYYDESLAKESINEQTNSIDKSLSTAAVSRASAVPIGTKVSSKDLAPAGTKYKYGYSTKTTTQFRGNARNIAIGIAALVPFLSVTVGVIGIIDGLKNMNQPMLYIKQNVYHSASYRYYRYHTYMYKRSNYTNRVGKPITQYRQMW